MKKILSLVLVLAMLAGIAVIPAVAEDDVADKNVYMQTNFPAGITEGDNFYYGAYTVQDGVLVGYADAMALQTTKGWMAYDITCRIMTAADDNVPEGSPRYVSIAHNNYGEVANGIRDNSRFMSLVYDVVNGNVYLLNDTFTFDQNKIIAGPVKVDIEADDTEFHDFGMSVTDRRIRCFVDGVCVIDYVDTEDKYFIGDIVEVEDEPIMVLWNDKNCLMYEEITVTAPGYTYPIPGNVASFALDAHPVKEGDTEITVDFTVEIPQGGSGYDLGAFYTLIGYDKERMSVAEETCSLVDDIRVISVFSEDLTDCPLAYVWATTSPKCQFVPGEKTATARIKFVLNEPAARNEKFEFTLGTIMNEDGGVYSMASQDGTYEQIKYALDELSFTGDTVVATPVYDAALSLEAQPVKEGDTEVTVELVATLPENATGYELGSFGLELSYDSSLMTMADEPVWGDIGGSFISSGNLSAQPYKLLWVSIDHGKLNAGRNTVCTMTFTLKEAAKVGDVLDFGLAADENNGICSMPSRDGAYSEIVYTEEDAVALGTSVTVDRAVLYGDVDGDGKIVLADVTEVLKYIAKWQGVDINTTAADVNCDEAVNLNDVTLMLQSIAKWDVTLGPKA